MQTEQKQVPRQRVVDKARAGPRAVSRAFHEAGSGGAAAASPLPPPPCVGLEAALAPAEPLPTGMGLLEVGHGDLGHLSSQVLRCWHL